MKKDININGNYLVAAIIFGTGALIMLKILKYINIDWWLIFLPYSIVAIIWVICAIYIMIYATKRQKAKIRMEETTKSLNNLIDVLKKAQEDEDERDS